MRLLLACTEIPLLHDAGVFSAANAGLDTNPGESGPAQSGGGVNTTVERPQAQIPPAARPLRHRAPRRGRTRPRLGHERRVHLDHPHRRRTLHRLPDRKSPRRRRFSAPLDLPKARRSVPFSADRSTAFVHRAALEERIPIFAISTYDTDYVLIQEEFAWAIDVLREAGHELV